MSMEPSVSWLHGVYEGLGEIDTRYGYMSILGFFDDGSDLFAQGDEANEIIEAVYQIWIDWEMTQFEAFQYFIALHR